MIDKPIKANGKLEGKVVIVTGGASGIGRATCFTLTREGAGLVVVDIDKVGIDELVADLEHQRPDLATSETPLGLALDMRDEEDAEKMANQTLKRFGRIDILVHCAGILRSKESGPNFLHQISVEEWEEVVETNLKGTFLSNRAVLPTMIQQRGGQIINFSSTSGLKGRAFDSAYCASKFGVIGMSEALAEEVRQYGIRVHVVLPDAVDTPMWDQNKPVRPPEGSLAPDRVANLVCYLALLPEDTVLGNLIVLPFHTRRRRKRKK
jgi:NAD(P)-dependent dehydrogenase (short-subunit alcohol dehydrogenase family)